MKRNLLFYSLLIASVLMLSNCRKEELVKVNGIVSGKILDASTNTGLADVAITVKGTKCKGTTKTDGTFEVSGIPAGEYIMVFSKEGYMVGKYQVWIDFSGAASKKSSKVDYRSIMEDRSLYPLTGKAAGVVFNEDGTLSSSATVKLNFNSYDIDSTFTATTDANGEFSFTALPFSPYYSAYASALKGDASESDYDNYGPTATKTLAFQIGLTQGTFKFLYGNFMNDGNRNFPVTSNIELTFSEDIDLATTLKHGSVYLYNEYADDYIGVDITVSGKKLIINPKRDLVKDGYYRVYGDVYANENKLASFDEYFYTTRTTPIVPMDVTAKPTISMDVAKTELYITPPTGALYVYIYRASSPSAEFLRLGYFYGPFTTITYDISSDATGTSYYVIARGYDVNNHFVYGAQSDVVTK